MNGYDQLKPCPFCRKTAFLNVEKDGATYYVFCDWDASQGPKRLNEEDCRWSWNKRVIDKNSRSKHGR